MRTLSLFLSLIFATLFLVAPLTSAVAQSESELKSSLMDRVSSIDKLKLTEKVGENNLGLLSQRSRLTPDETKLMNAENKDRRALYGILARRLNLTVKVVGQGRAEELREKSADGVWLQDPSGKWYQQE